MFLATSLYLCYHQIKREMMKRVKWLLIVGVSIGVGLWYFYNSERLMEQYAYLSVGAVVILWLFWKIFMMYKKTRFNNDGRIQIQFVEG